MQRCGSSRAQILRSCPCGVIAAVECRMRYTHVRMKWARRTQPTRASMLKFVSLSTVIDTSFWRIFLQLHCFPLPLSFGMKHAGLFFPFSSIAWSQKVLMEAETSRFCSFQLLSTFFRYRSSSRATLCLPFSTPLPTSAVHSPQRLHFAIDSISESSTTAPPSGAALWRMKTHIIA